MRALGALFVLARMGKQCKLCDSKLLPMKKPKIPVLVTTFGIFGDYRANSSQLTGEKLKQPHDSIRFHVVELLATIPPDVEDRGANILHTAMLIEAKAIVCLGMASEKTTITIETIAYNQVDCPKYCPADQNGKRIDQSRDANDSVMLDVSDWNIDAYDQKRWESDRSLLPIEFYLDAGRFCCNHLMWQLHAFRRLHPGSYGQIPLVFMHVPCTPECVSQPEAFRAAGKTMVELGALAHSVLAFIETAAPFAECDHSGTATHVSTR